MKVTIRSPDGDRDSFDIVAGVLLEDTSAPYLFILYLDNVLLMSIDLIKENGFMLKQDNKQTMSCRNSNRRRVCR